MTQATVHVDVTCEMNRRSTAPGGYGTVITMNNEETELAQGYTSTTNNRMELMGIIAALKQIPSGHFIEVHSRSQTICNAFNHGWLKNWLSNGWQTTNRKPVENRDLWQELLKQAEPHEVTWTWAYGNRKTPLSKRTYRLACQAARCGNLQSDNGTSAATL